MRAWLGVVLVVVACDSGNRKPKPSSEAPAVGAPTPATADAAAPQPAGVVRPADAIELGATGGDVHELVIGDTHVYWTTQVEGTDDSYSIVHWAPRAGGAPPAELKTPMWIRGAATAGDDLYLTGRVTITKAKPPFDAVVLRVRDGKLDSFATSRTTKDVLASSGARVHDGKLYWREGQERAHGGGPILVTDLATAKTRTLVPCTDFDGHHAKCPSMLFGDRPVAVATDGKLRALSASGMKDLGVACPCGSEAYYVVGDQLLCIRAQNDACEEQLESVLVPLDGSRAMPIGTVGYYFALGYPDDLALVGGFIYHVITDKGLHRRKGRNAPDELVAGKAERFAVGQGTLVWTESDRLWSAPLPQ